MPHLFIAVVGLIGFMNMANTMIMNITTKKQEYGVLQAVGMTNKQLNLFENILLAKAVKMNVVHINRLHLKYVSA